jgi:hypothetical protein
VQSNGTSCGLNLQSPYRTHRRMVAFECSAGNGAHRRQAEMKRRSYKDAVNESSAECPGRLRQRDTTARITLAFAKCEVISSVKLSIVRPAPLAASELASPASVGLLHCFPAFFADKARIGLACRRTGIDGRPGGARCRLRAVNGVARSVGR